jgi:succinylglutamic semialdehyde dehydrogenase
MTAKIGISIKAHADRTATFSAGTATTRFRPHGVLAVIGPYNFPAHLPNGHICPALLAGNTVLFKPSELAPATAELTLALWRKTGLPEGVLQLVQGGAEPSIALAGHAEVDGVLFTGSAATGKKLAQSMAATPGRMLALEMGGNNPLIVDPGRIENLDAAAEITLRSAFLSAGQRCTCARRLVLIESDASAGFLDRLVERTRSITVDDPFSQPQPFMGPLASVDFPGPVRTGFVSPGILDVTPVGQLPDEEIFGPLLQLIRVPDLESAIQVANDTRYGLAAGILTDREEDYAYAGPRLRAGIINWNTQLTGASSAAPFGGIKDSGNLRPSAYFAADYCAYPVASMETPVCGDQPDLPGR